MDLEERIFAIEEEIRKTPYHKGTEHHIGKLRARLSKLKKRTTQKHSQSSGIGFAIKKQGDATVILLGPPSVGKSTLLNSLTSAFSKVGDYDFTTVKVIPGMLWYKGAQIQILDIPGIISGAAGGKGRGREILSVAKNADLLLLMVDIESVDKIFEIQKELLKIGIGVGESLPVIIVINKIDSASKRKLVKLESKNTILVSAKKGEGIDKLKKVIWQKLNLIRIFSKSSDGKIDFKKPLILKKGAMVYEAAEKISKELAVNIKSARVWGSSVKYKGQYVGSRHQLADGDILSLIKRG